MKKSSLILLLFNAVASAQSLQSNIEQELKQVEPKVIQWRRTFHQNPELGNQEFQTAKLIANHLRSLGLKVEENIAVTGIVGTLTGAKPGPVMALRADMDALPVTERVNVPFKSKVVVDYEGQKTGVMHACGHDSHMAILLGTAEVLSHMKKDIAGTVKFIFQPAEEGLPANQKPFGADGMIKAGVLDNPKVDAIFGLHINSLTPVGTIALKEGSLMAAVDLLKINVKGTQTHGAYPWAGADPIVASSQIVSALQSVIARSTDISKAPAVVTIGSIHGGIRNNIIPEEVNMVGTIRNLDKENRKTVLKRIKEVAENVARGMNCTAEVVIEEGYPITYNHESLTKSIWPILEKTAGKDRILKTNAVLGGEDFSYYQEKVPGVFFLLGGMDPSKKPEEVSAHHTPDFYLDESGFILGVKAFVNLILDYPKINQ